MDEKKIANVKKVKRALIEKQNIIRGKFESVLKTRLGTERKLGKKYKPIITEIKKLQPKKNQANRRNGGRNRQNEENIPEDDHMDDSSDEADSEGNDELEFDDFFPTAGTSPQQQPSVHTDDNSDFDSVIETPNDGSIPRAIKREPVSDYDEFDDDIDDEYGDYTTKKGRMSKNTSKTRPSDQRRIALDYRNRKLETIRKKFFQKPFPALKRRASPETIQNIQKGLRLDEDEHASLLDRTRPIVERKKKALDQIKMVRRAHPPIQPESYELGQRRSPLVQQIQQTLPKSSDPIATAISGAQKQRTDGSADSDSDGSNQDLPRQLDPLSFSKSITSHSGVRRPPKKQVYVQNPLRKRSRQALEWNPRKFQRFNASDYLTNIRRLRQKSGKGLQNEFVKYGDRVVYEYYDDPNELCDRLKLLVSSKQAGNTNHDYEINSIVEELREADIIN